MRETKPADKIIIGQKEKVDFPKLNRFSITARIDTGARSSSAHCDKMWVEEIDGKNALCCYFLKSSNKVTRFYNYQKKKVKSSNGIYQIRYAVKLRIKLGSVEKVTEVTLTDRSTMNYSVLLGRRFLSPEFLVDASKSYITTGKTKAKARK